MTEVAIIGVDLAKRVFQVHGAAADGSVVFRKKLSRAQFLQFLARQPACTVAMEARLSILEQKGATHRCNNGPSVELVAAPWRECSPYS